MEFGNLAGAHKDNDKDCAAELEAAGIPVVKLEPLRKQGEVQTAVRGELGPWMFTRAWRYWVAEGAGLPLDLAERLHEKFGKTVRVEGHCGCPSPREWGKGFAINSYHVDDAEGLKALADAIKEVMEAHEKSLTA
jgi:hypothetical protein